MGGGYSPVDVDYWNTRGYIGSNIYGVNSNANSVGNVILIDKNFIYVYAASTSYQSLCRGRKTNSSSSYSIIIEDILDGIVLTNEDKEYILDMLPESWSVIVSQYIYDNMQCVKFPLQ